MEGWRIGKPDVVLSMTKAFSVPASGTIDYQYIVVPTGFTEDKYVQMAEARPGNPALVHHILTFIREPGNPWLRNLKPGIPFDAREAEQQARENAQKNPRAQGQGRGQQAISFGDNVAGYAPGTMPDIMVPGEAKLIPAGSDIIFQVHYTANGTPGTDVSKLGLVFAKGPVTNACCLWPSRRRISPFLQAIPTTR